MKKLLAVLLLSASMCKGQNIINNNVSIGIADSLHSAVLKETERFWVSLPTSFYNSKFSKSHYPVIYVFDGDLNFATVAAMQKQLSIRSGSTIIPEAIVVGVMNNNRNRDFTPYQSSFWMFNTPSPLGTTGGGEKFVKYLQNELIPHIDSLYPTAPYRVLLGHSLGGLAAANIFVNHTKLFNAYIIMDPSMWYDNQGFLAKARKALANKNLSGTTVYLGMAHSMGPGFNISNITKDTTGETLHPRAILHLKTLLESKIKNGLRFKFGFYDDNSHMSLPLIAEYNGFRFIFNYYNIPPAIEYSFIVPNNNSDPAKYLVDHYKVISAHLGYDMLPSENLVSIIAHTAEDAYMPQKALSLYELNVKNYPQSYGAWFYLGEFYEGQKENDKAIACYKKAFSLNALPEIQTKLTNLESK
jgi:uncharacterized protein